MNGVRILGHPIHPMLVVVPIGAFPTAALLDAVAAATGDVGWHRASLAALALGLAVLLVALVPGTIDLLQQTPRGGRPLRVGIAHMALGLALGLVAALDLALHAVTWDGPGPAARAAVLAAGGLLVLMVAAQAFLGATLVTVHGLGLEEAG